MGHLKQVIDYISQAYGEDGAKQLSKVEMVSRLAMAKNPPTHWRQLVDKVALFNGIEKVAL